MLLAYEHHEDGSTEITIQGMRVASRAHFETALKLLCDTGVLVQAFPMRRDIVVGPDKSVVFGLAN